MPKAKKITTQRKNEPYSKSSLRRQPSISMDDHGPEDDIDSIIDVDSIDLNKQTGDKDKVKAKKKPKDANMVDAQLELKTIMLDMQAKQVTKDDMAGYSESINKQFQHVTEKIEEHSDQISLLNKRMDECEKSAASAQYNVEVNKQKLLRNNISIFGLPHSENENLGQVVQSVLEAIGCGDLINAVSELYRLKGNSNKIIMARLYDHDAKHRILLAKTKKVIKAKDIVGGECEDVLYINNHVTPFFGKLLHEGRKLVKEGKMHSCWINSFGCQLKFSLNDKSHVYKSIDELHDLVGKFSGQPIDKPRKRREPDHPSSSTNTNKR